MDCSAARQGAVGAPCLPDTGCTVAGGQWNAWLQPEEIRMDAPTDSRREALLDRQEGGGLGSVDLWGASGVGWQCERSLPPENRVSEWAADGRVRGRGEDAGFQFVTSCD